MVFKLLLCGNNFFMKKKFVVIYILFILMVLLLAPLNSKNDFDNIVIKASSVKVEYFCSENVVDDKLDIQSVGYGCIISCDYNSKNLVQEKLKNIQGVSYYLGVKDFDLSEFLILNKASIVSRQDFDNIKIIYALTPRLKKVVKNNKNFNLEIAITESGVTIGYPIIMGSY